MLVAVDSMGSRRVAGVREKGSDHTCPDCRQEVVMRLGDKRVPHFAHRAGKQCAEARAAERRRRAEARMARKSDEIDGQQEIVF